MTKEEREVFTKRLSKILELIDKNGNTYTFKVTNKFFDGNDYVNISDELLREKLILAHMEPNLQYLVVEYTFGWAGMHYKNIRYVLSDTSYVVGNTELKTNHYKDTCSIVSDLCKYFS